MCLATAARTDVETFIEHWDVKPVAGMELEILDKTDWDVYDCVVTKIEDGKIFVKRHDKDAEQMADVVCLQTPSDEDDEDDWF